jgi:hypothetical protein
MHRKRMGKKGFTQETMLMGALYAVVETEEGIVLAAVAL